MAGIVAYEIKWPIKFLGRVVLSTIKLKNCAEESENRCFTVEYGEPTDRGANFDLPRKQKGPQKSTKGGGCCNECCLARGVFDN